MRSAVQPFARHVRSRVQQLDEITRELSLLSNATQALLTKINRQLS